MQRFRFLLLAAPFLFFFSVSGRAQKAPDVTDYLGPLFAPAARPPIPLRLKVKHESTAAGVLRHWNSLAVDASGLDHTPVALGESRVFGEQLGPTRASRAMAIVHIAMFDAVDTLAGEYASYSRIARAHRSASMPAAIAQAAHDTLVALFPSQRPSFDEELGIELADLPNDRGRLYGIDLGRRAAAAILAARYNDGSQQTEPQLGIQFFPGNSPGQWRQDPVSQSPIAFGAYWGGVRPFVLHSGSQFRAPIPPALNTPEYAAAYQEAKLYGGDGVITPTIRTSDQTEIGTFWAYDGTPSLCAPPRLYNQLTMHLADQLGTSANVVELARLLVLVNVSMADACISIWESKYFYQYWRPITGIRESDTGTGPSGLGDGNAATIGDLTFMPLGAPASNLTGPNFTPPFPSYPSGHGGFGGAVFQTLRNFYRRDDIAFTFTSDEFDGTTVDSHGQVRPLKPRSFSSFSQAEEENGQSRIYLGIHWSFDKMSAIAQGREVANYIFANAFLHDHRKHAR